MQAVNLSHFEQSRVRRTDPVHRIDINREEDSEDDQKKFALLSDTEPSNDERDQCEMRNVPNHLERRIQNPVRHREKAVYQAKNKTDCSSDEETDHRSLKT